MLVNLIRMMILPKPSDIEVGWLYELTGFKSPYIITPLVSSAIGILFWTTLVDVIGRPLYENRMINYISENTIYVLGYHVFFFNVLNCILKTVNSYIISLPDFSDELFIQSNYYFWNPIGKFNLVYLIIGLAGPLAVKYEFDKFVMRCKENKHIHK